MLVVHLNNSGWHIEGHLSLFDLIVIAIRLQIGDTQLAGGVDEHGHLPDGWVALHDRDYSLLHSSGSSLRQTSSVEFHFFLCKFQLFYTYNRANYFLVSPDLCLDHYVASGS